MAVTKISDKASVTRWRSVSGDAISLRHGAGIEAGLVVLVCFGVEALATSQSQRVPCGGSANCSSSQPA